MTLRVIDGGRGDDEDDDLDAFARRDEDPRASLGYVTPVHPTMEPRLRARPTGAPTHWRFIESNGPAPDAGPIGGAKVCKPKTATYPGCGEPATVLHQDPRTSTPERVLCSRCTGDVMRARVGDARPSEPTPDRRGR